MVSCVGLRARLVLLNILGDDDVVRMVRGSGSSGWVMTCGC